MLSAVDYAVDYKLTNKGLFPFSLTRRCQVLRTLTGLIKHAKLSDVYELTNNYNNLKLNIK